MIYVDPVTGDCVDRAALIDRMVNTYGMSLQETLQWMGDMEQERDLESDDPNDFLDKLEKRRKSI